MKRLFFSITALLFLTVIPLFSTSQDSTKSYSVLRRGMIRSTATITPSLFTNGGINAVYIHGVLEYYLDKRISLRGDGFYFLDIISKKTNTLSMNHSLHAGPSFHFIRISYFDPYVSLQPGLSFTDDNREICNVTVTGNSSSYTCSKTGNSTDPLLSLIAGFNYFATKWFHLFGEVRYTYGVRLVPILYGSIPLSELKFSFGLGFNIRHT